MRKSTYICVKGRERKKELSFRRTAGCCVGEAINLPTFGTNRFKVEVATYPTRGGRSPQLVKKRAVEAISPNRLLQIKNGISFLSRIPPTAPFQMIAVWELNCYRVTNRPRQSLSVFPCCTLGERAQHKSIFFGALWPDSFARNRLSESIRAWFMVSYDECSIVVARWG